MQTLKQKQKQTNQEPQSSVAAGSKRFFTSFHALPAWLLLALTLTLVLIFWDQSETILLVAGVPRETMSSLAGLGMRSSWGHKTPEGWMVTAISDSSGNPTDPVPDPPPEG